MAVTLTAPALAEALDINPAVAERLLAVSKQLVTDYADAPDPVSDEAVIRCAGWLYGRTPGVSEVEIGDYRERFPAGQLSALRHSGAMALLSSYKRRRAGVIR